MRCDSSAGPTHLRSMSQSRRPLTAHVRPQSPAMKRLSSPELNDFFEKYDVFFDSFIKHSRDIITRGIEKMGEWIESVYSSRTEYPRSTYIEEENEEASKENNGDTSQYWKAGTAGNRKQGDSKNRTGAPTERMDDSIRSIMKATAILCFKAIETTFSRVARRVSGTDFFVIGPKPVPK